MNFSDRTREFGQVLESTTFSAKSGHPFEQGEGFELGLHLLEEAHQGGNRVFIVGNGGSAAVASHIVNDFVNNGQLKATTLHDPALLTCMTNDYGYEHAYARILKTQAGVGDLLIAISSSGQSKNILNAVHAMDEAGGHTFTLSGFRHDNPLRECGRLNGWLDVSDYGFVEIGHLFLLHYLIDRFKRQLEGGP